MNFFNFTFFKADTSTVFRAVYTVFEETAEKELSVLGLIFWRVFIALVALSLVYMVYNIICNKIQIKRNLEREKAKPKLIISQADNFGDKKTDDKET
ncbi:MAG: hypothetical protein R3Y35_05380 [Clostridia bacterium]